jgi:hypothetical protein
MRTKLSVAVLLTLLCTNAFAARFAAGAPATTNNDDSCDIGNYPAATLLLPYFEVDFSTPQTVAQTTLFSVTNTSNRAQIARVTLWTDWSYPVVNFNLFLTGYDVQAINLYDILARGVIGAVSPTLISTTPGALSEANAANPNFTNVTQCNSLPGRIPAQLLSDIRNMLTLGTAAGCGTARVGGVHTSAIGYATVDLVSSCGFTTPRDGAAFFDDLLYDNVLMGDYQQVNPNPATGNFAGGNPMVHIRAVPDGGKAASVTPATNLPYTFYDRFTPKSGVRTRDRRQPLPSAFAARYIQGGAGNFNTNFKIWREGRTTAGSACTEFLTKESAVPVAELVRFDEHENPTVNESNIIILFPPIVISLPATSSTSTSSSVYPPLSTSGDVAGWLYLNLNNGGSTEYSAAASHDYKTGTSTTTGERQSQNWVITSMSAEGRYSVDFDAMSLGNGCSPAPAESTANLGQHPIGPAPDGNP